ncbi:MAG: DmsE family decaheme c-type cytochrome [Acidobacteria bacterium]|nr:DmsE family decaheme c-type cytochrome [Acidobacteriota bacterium]
MVLSIRSLLAVLLFWLGPAGSANAQQSTAGLPCQTCHPAQAGTFHRNPHQKLAVASGTQVTACEGCHVGSVRHGLAKTIEEKRAIRPRSFQGLDSRATLDACLTCHSKDLSRANIHRSEHTMAKVACTSCHSVHGAASSKSLLARKQSELCTGCHTQVRAQFNMPFKHRVNEGFMQCSDCHNPHGTNAPTWRMGGRPRLVDHAFGNEEACLKCHTDKRGPFVFEHAAVRVDGCETCHSPHGSTNPRLLRRPTVFTLCLECHNGAGNFGRTGDGISTQSASHNMTDPRYRNCTTCHLRIHGSNSDQRFLR